MAAADLEPAERDRANQREAVPSFHASHPPYIMTKENLLVSSKYWNGSFPQHGACGRSLGLPYAWRAEDLGVVTLNL